MLSDDRCGTNVEMHLSVCNDVVWVEMVAADLLLCGCIYAGTQPMFGVTHILIFKWCMDSFSTFMNECCAEG